MDKTLGGDEQSQEDKLMQEIQSAYTKSHQFLRQGRL